MILSSASKRFLQRLAHRLLAEDCKPVVLRNYRELPNSIGNDLDLFVPEKRLSAAKRILLEEIRFGGGILGQVHSRDYFAAYWVRFAETEDWWHVDLYPGAMTWHGLRYLSDDALVSGAITHGDWRVPRPAHEALISLLASVLWGGFVKDSYVTDIAGLLNDPEEAAEFMRCVSRPFGKAGKILGAAAIAGKPAEVLTPAVTRMMRRSLRKSSFADDPLHAARSTARYWLRELHCYLIDRPGLRVEFPRDDAAAPANVSAAVGKLFGRVITEQAGSGSTIQRWITRFRASGGNFLLLTPGERWAIGGIPCPELDQNTSSVRTVVARHMQRRLERHSVAEDPPN